LARHRAAGDRPGDARRRQLVVDAPAHVVGARGAAVAPPGVFDRIGPGDAEAVLPAARRRLDQAVAVRVGDHAVEPGALGRQAAGVLLVAGPVLDVAAGAHDVPVAAQHVFAAAGQPLVHDRLEPVHHLELEALAQLAGRAGRDVERHHRQVAVAGLDVAALVVERRPAQCGAHLVGLAPAVDRHPAVALLRHRVAVMAVAQRAEAGIGQLAFLGLGFLQADDVGLLALQPVEEPLVRRGADAVGVEADDAHAVDRKTTSRKPSRNPASTHAGAYSGLAHELRLQPHLADAVDPAVDVVVAV